VEIPLLLTLAVLVVPAILLLAALGLVAAMVATLADATPGALLIRPAA
jgi:hypothetical protein